MIDLFNQHNLKQINLHIRRYIVNTVKEKKIDLYDKIKEYIRLTFIQTNNENILVENIQVFILFKIIYLYNTS